MSLSGVFHPCHPMIIRLCIQPCKAVNKDELCTSAEFEWVWAHIIGFSAGQLRRHMSHFACGPDLVRTLGRDALGACACACDVPCTHPSSAPRKTKLSRSTALAEPTAHMSHACGDEGLPSDAHAATSLAAEEKMTVHARARRHAHNILNR